TQEDTLTCTACGNRVRLDEYGFLHPVGEQDRAYSTVSEWVEFQQSRIREEIASGQFRLSTPAEIRVNDAEKKQKHVRAGEGVLTLDKKEFRYEGTLRGEAVTLTFPVQEVFKCPFRAGDDFEIPNTGEILAFAPQEGRMVSHFVQAVPVLRELQ
ncbi:MAG: hypothetical protein IJC67_01805, partial [Clostridia bacterium]|nr:hypothetical protein [Clostridia bacterium]